MAKAVIENYHGSPAIMINGEPYPPMMATIRTNAGDQLKFDSSYFYKLGKAGIRIFFLICDTEWLKPGAFTQMKTEVEMLLKAIPDAWIFLRIGLHPPLNWCEEHPEELIHFLDGSIKPVHLFTETYECDLPGMYSLCSQKWREDAGKALKETCESINNLPFSDRIIGYFLAAGYTSEWHYTGFNKSGTCCDTSQAFMRYYSKYLKKKYGTSQSLRKAWNNNEVTLNQPIIPDVEQRYFIAEVDKALENPPHLYSNDPPPKPPQNGTNIGVFANIDKFPFVVDYFQAWHQGTADSIIYFAQIVKDIAPDKLIGAFYGSYGCTDFHYSGTAGAVLSLLDSGKIDFLAAPGVYENRQPGGYTGQREMVNSFLLRNKLFIVEEDTRTHEENSFYQNFVEMYDIKDTINIMKRDFGRNLCENLQAWWFDQHIGGGRYKAPEILDLIKEQQKIACKSYEKNRVRHCEIAYIYDEDSIYTVSNKTTKEAIENNRNYELSMVGVPGDQYFHNDMANSAMPDYKLYVFFNVYTLTDKEQQVIHQKLCKNNAVALWLYAPGYINLERTPKISLSYMENLIGMKMNCYMDYIPSKFRLSQEDHSIISDLDHGRIWGCCDRLMQDSIHPRYNNSISYLYPAFYVDDKKAIVLGKYLQGQKTALAIKEVNGFTSIFCGTRYLNSDLLRKIAEFAGCHLYIKSDDVLYASDNYVTIHAYKTGEKKIYFPILCSPKEIYENRIYGQNVKEIHFDMLRGETKTFEL